MSADRPVPVPPRLHLFRRVPPAPRAVGPRSAALFRFGEHCNNHCPMCSNTGRLGLQTHPEAELLRRARYLHASGFRRAVVTGGEPTIHPAFWTVVAELHRLEISWDINTHGRTFADPTVSRRAIALGLDRAIVSLHSHIPAISAEIFGADVDAHDETVAGIDHLVAAGAGVMLNCVLSRANLDHVEDYAMWGLQRFGRRVAFKFVFPSTLGKGGRWPAIAQLRYSETHDAVARLRRLGATRRMRVLFEAFPNCILGDPVGSNVGRSGFGESHYLDDDTGDVVYRMREIEASLASFAPQCRECTAVARCCGFPPAYAERWGIDEFAAFARANVGVNGRENQAASHG